MPFDYIPTSPSLQDFDGSATCNVFLRTHLKHEFEPFFFFLRFFLNLGVVPNNSTQRKLIERVSEANE